MSLRRRRPIGYLKLLIKVAQFMAQARGGSIPFKKTSPREMPFGWKEPSLCLLVKSFQDNIFLYFFNICFIVKSFKLTRKSFVKFLVKHFTNWWAHTTSSLSKKTKCVLSPEKRQNKDQNKSKLIEPTINLVYFLATQDEYYLQWN